MTSPRQPRLTTAALLALAAGLPPAARARDAVPAAPRPVPPRTAPPLRVCAGGDVTLGTNLGVARAPRDPTRLLAPLRPLVAGADLVLVNVEGAIGDGPAPEKCAGGASGCFALRQPPGAAAALRALAPHARVVGNVANNHARDAGAPGAAETRRRLAEAGVLVTGADTLATPVPTRDGDTVAVLGFATSGIPDARDLAAVRRHVARAAARWSRVVVTMHLGAEGAGAQRTLDAPERYLGASRGNPVAFADAAVEAGASLVVGHGPHVVRAVEWQGPALVAYSLGNLATYGPFSLRPPLDRGAVLCATIARSGVVTGARLLPTRLRAPGVPAPDRAGAALRLADSLGRLDFPETRAAVSARGTLTRAAPWPRG